MTEIQTRNKTNIIPWVIVGIVVAVALIAATLFVKSQQQQTTVTDSKQSQSAESEAETETTIPQTQDVPVDTVPEVETGQTFALNITQWNKQVQVSYKLGRMHYELINGNQQAVLSTTLIDELPESCAAMRTQFGFNQEDNKLTVMKPAEVCQEAPDLYNEIWGLLDAAAKTAQ